MMNFSFGWMLLVPVCFKVASRLECLTSHYWRKGFAVR
jgi:hypothetical protein